MTGWKFIAIVVEPQDEAISYEGKYYIRSGSTTQELRGHELLRFLKSRMDIRWEERPRPEANLDDIDRSIQGVRQIRQTGDTGRRFARDTLQRNHAQGLRRNVYPDADMGKRDRAMESGTLAAGFYHRHADAEA